MPEYEVFVDSKSKRVELTRTGEDSFQVRIDGRTRTLTLPNKTDFTKPFTIKIDDKDYKIEPDGAPHTTQYSEKIGGVPFKIEVKIPIMKAGMTPFTPTVSTAPKKTVNNTRGINGAINAPMTGKVVAIKIKKGDPVKLGQVVCVIEAMKMENEITAVKTGTVKDVHVKEGSPVNEGEPLITVT